jgi:outer membrane protein assembly factor BamB
MSRIASKWSCVLLAAAMLFPGCRKNQVPGSVAVPSGPDYDRTGQQLAFSSSASDPDEDSVAIRFDWGDGDTSAWSSAVIGGAVVTDSHAWSGADTYAVRAQARDSRGALSGWSNPHSLSIVSDSLPRAPILEIPSGFVVGDTMANEIAVRDPNEDSVAVRVSWGDGDTTDWSELAHDGGRVMFYHAWRDTGTMLVTAQARDAKGFVSDWSKAYGVSVWRPKWRYRTDDRIQSSPAIGADGTLYIGSFDHCLYAIDPQGNFRWRKETGSRISSSPAVGPDGTVYFGSQDSSLYAVNPDGTLKWSGKTGGAIQSSPATAADGTVYVGSDDSGLYAFDTNGALKWSYSTGGTVRSSPAVAEDGTVYVGSNDHHLYAIDPNGALKWSVATGDVIYSSPAIGSDGTVYFGSNDKYLYAIDPSGVVKWRYPIGSAVRSSPVVAADGTVYVGSDYSHLFAIDPQGTLKWQYDAECYIANSPAVASDGTVFFTSDGCYLYALYPDGSLRWKKRPAESFESSPAIGSDGTVYVGSNDSYLYAIAGGPALALAPWPKFHRDNRNTGRVDGGR